MRGPSAWIRLGLACACLALVLVLLWNPAGFDAADASRDEIFWHRALPGFGAALLLLLAVLPRLLQVNLALLLAIGLAIEGGLRLLPSPAAESVRTTIEAPYTESDPVLGYRPIAGARTRVLKRRGSEPIFDATYEIDDYHRRRIEVNGTDRDHFLLFFGGSFAFGDGIDARDTLPYQAGLLSARHRPYSYAFSGYGPNHMLAIVSETPFPAGIAERDGIAVYVFIDGHLGRASGDLHSFTYARNSPRFVLDGDDRVVRAGGLVTDRPVRSALYSLLGKLQTFRRAGVNIPRLGGEQQILFTARLIEDTRRHLAERTGSDRLVVMLYPGSEHGEALAARLRERGIEVLDYSALAETVPEVSDRIPGDGHPTGTANRALASQLVRDLGIAR